MSKKVLLSFFTGFISATIMFPVLRALGVPGFEDLLIAMFGPDNIFGVIFGFAVVGVLVAVSYVAIKKLSVAKES